MPEMLNKNTGGEMMSKRQPDRYVAREELGELYLFDNQPTRERKQPANEGMWTDKINYTGELLEDDHPLGKDLTWEDEPRPLYITQRNPDDVGKLVEVASNSLDKAKKSISMGCFPTFSGMEELEQALEPFTKESM